MNVKANAMWGGPGREQATDQVRRLGHSRQVRERIASCCPDAECTALRAARKRAGAAWPTFFSNRVRGNPECVSQRKEESPTPSRKRQSGPIKSLALITIIFAPLNGHAGERCAEP